MDSAALDDSRTPNVSSMYSELTSPPSYSSRQISSTASNSRHAVFNSGVVDTARIHETRRSTGPWSDVAAIRFGVFWSGACRGVPPWPVCGSQERGSGRYRPLPTVTSAFVCRRRKRQLCARFEIAQLYAGPDGLFPDVIGKRGHREPVAPTDHPHGQASKSVRPRAACGFASVQNDDLACLLVLVVV